MVNYLHLCSDCRRRRRVQKSGTIGSGAIDFVIYDIPTQPLKTDGCWKSYFLIDSTLDRNFSIGFASPRRSPFLLFSFFGLQNVRASSKRSTKMKYKNIYTYVPIVYYMRMLITFIIFNLSSCF